MFSKKGDAAFITTGFGNYKKAIEKFEIHEKSDCHNEARVKIAFLKGPSISVQLNTQIAKLQSVRRSGLLFMLQGLRFLLRQGIAIRGHFEEEGSLRQLLLAWSSSCKDLQEWNKEGKYMSHEIINEFIKLMGNTVLRNIITNIKSCEPCWYSIIADETTYITCKEQMNVCIRYVDDEYVVNEDSLGIHCIPNIKAETLFVALKNVLACCGLSLSLCRGQAYDGASAMQGRRKGLATLIKTEVPAALPVHCLAHSLNLCLQDASRKILLLRDAIDLVREIAKLINFSPKRKYLFNEKLLQCEDREVNGIRTWYVHLPLMCVGLLPSEDTTY